MLCFVFSFFIYRTCYFFCRKILICGMKVNICLNKISHFYQNRQMIVSNQGFFCLLISLLILVSAASYALRTPRVVTKAFDVVYTGFRRVPCQMACQKCLVLFICVRRWHNGSNLPDKVVVWIHVLICMCTCHNGPNLHNKVVAWWVMYNKALPEPTEDGWLTQQSTAHRASFEVCFSQCLPVLSWYLSLIHWNPVLDPSLTFLSPAEAAAFVFSTPLFHPPPPPLLLFFFFFFSPSCRPWSL